MSGIWFDPAVLADSLSETVGYKAGLALSLEQICDHLGGEEADLVLESEKRVVRLRPEEYEQLFYKLLHRVGHTDEEYDGDYLGIRLFHKYKNNARKEYEGVLSLFAEMMPKMLEETHKKGVKVIDPTPLLLECSKRYGELGAKIAFEKLKAIDKGLHMNPFTTIRYHEWSQQAELDALFAGGNQQPEQAKFLDQRYIDYLSVNKDRLPEIHWRKFEELSAEFFSRQGYSVEIGPGRNDDGVDIRVWKPDGAATDAPLCLVQCKRQKDKIEKVVVKGLVADVAFEKADYGVIVTTSALSPGARTTVVSRGYPIKEVERQAVEKWLTELRTPGSGIVRV